MNRSKLIPKYSKRYHQIKKVTKIAAYSAVMLVTLAFLGYGIVSGLPPVTAVREDGGGEITAGENAFLPEPIPEDLFCEDESEDLFGEFFYENDEPIAMGIYEDIFSEDDVTVPAGELKIVKTDLSKSPAPGTVLLKNNTSYKIKSKDYLTADKLTLPSSVGTVSAADTEKPLVLIYHSHGTEAYAEEGRTSYLKKKLPRSTDITKNVVAIGGVIADVLDENGIPTLHCEIMHDKDSYNNAYTYSKATLREYLEKYPSIKYCFDVHRDALLNSTTVYKVLTYDGSTPVAQVMFVVGTDANGANHPNWGKNLSLAVDAQYLLSMRLENLMRPICIRSCTFWQEYCEGGLLLEVGTCVNTLAEAKAAANIVGQTLSTLIRARENL